MQAKILSRHGEYLFVIYRIVYDILYGKLEENRGKFPLIIEMNKICNFFVKCFDLSNNIV